jgi:hypothetical protein
MKRFKFIVFTAAFVFSTVSIMLNLCYKTFYKYKNIDRNVFQFSNYNHIVTIDLDKNVLLFDSVIFYRIRRCDNLALFCIKAGPIEILAPKNCINDQSLIVKGWKLKETEVNFYHGMPDGKLILDVFQPKNNGNFAFNYNSLYVDRIFVDFSLRNGVDDMLKNGDGSQEIIPGPVAYYALKNQELFRCNTKMR